MQCSDSCLVILYRSVSKSLYDWFELPPMGAYKFEAFIVALSTRSFRISRDTASPREGQIYTEPINLFEILLFVAYRHARVLDSIVGSVVYFRSRFG